MGLRKKRRETSLHAARRAWRSSEPEKYDNFLDGELPDPALDIVVKLLAVNQSELGAWASTLRTHALFLSPKNAGKCALLSLNCLQYIEPRRPLYPRQSPSPCAKCGNFHSLPLEDPRAEFSNVWLHYVDNDIQGAISIKGNSVPARWQIQRRLQAILITAQSLKGGTCTALLEVVKIFPSWPKTGESLY